MYGSDTPSPVWFINIATNTLHPLQDVVDGFIPDGTTIGIVVQSLQQSHTTISHVQQRSTDM